MVPAVSDRAYNPLSVDELGQNAARALMGYRSDILPPKTPFAGAGVYTLHYMGPFKAYVGMPDQEPIYVGKADPPGKRQGRRAASLSASVLHQRLVHHSNSIASANNLDLKHFRCRWLVLDPVWISLTEQVLIAEYSPIWNVVVGGFGNNDPGRGRWNQRRSPWDTLHPGREWAYNLRDAVESAEDILLKIKSHRESR